MELEPAGVGEWRVIECEGSKRVLSGVMLFELGREERRVGSLGDDILCDSAAVVSTYLGYPQL